MFTKVNREKKPSKSPDKYIHRKELCCERLEPADASAEPDLDPMMTGDDRSISLVGNVTPHHFSGKVILQSDASHHITLHFPNRTCDVILPISNANHYQILVS